MERTTPSLREGLATIRRSPRLVLAVWLVPTLLVLPFVATVEVTLAPLLGWLPPHPPPGDLQLVAASAVGRFAAVYLVPVLVALVGIWLWTVWWHAGLVGWRVWGAGRRQRLGELLGLGILRLFRYLRFSFSALAALALLLAAVWIPAQAWIRSARRALHEAAAVNATLAALALSGLLVLLVLTATLRGLWELARPGRRSAVLAWLRGLRGTLRHPLLSLGTVLAWGVPSLLLWALPVTATLALGELGRGALGGVILEAGALLRAACAVGLVGSFAPVAGLGPLPRLENPPRGAEGADRAPAGAAPAAS